jgi:predicted nucleic acid-binding protein
MRYFDASALVKLYVREAGSAEVRRWLARDAPATSRLTEVEIASALARRCREGAVTLSERDRAAAALRRDLASMVVVELTADVAERARRLTISRALRTNDAIHLASCQTLDRALDQDVTFVAFDDRLTAAARAEGLMTT